MKSVKKTCSTEGCEREAGASGKCNRHSRLTPRKVSRFAHDRYRSSIGRTFPGGLDSVRTHLVDTLAEAVGETHADAVADALDAYLATDPADRSAPFQWLPPNQAVERDRAIEQRDEAVARAEKAEQELAAIKGSQMRRVKK